MWYKQLSIIIFFLCSFMAHGQQKSISGIIKNIDDKVVPFANIVINNTINPPKSITYGYSNEKGLFFLKIPSEIIDIAINITAIGYKEKTVLVKTDTIKTLKIYLEENVRQLEEVVIKARQTTDTLNIDINNMNLSKESTLRDMLNKTDGVIVSKRGGISYQGKQINKVLINNKEVFVNQNKIALDNLNYEIMDSVHIINNYKDNFTIDFNRIRDPVINVTTKSGFKGVVKANINTGYGFNKKYSFNGKGFFFSDKLNAFVTSHTNNVGQIELSQKDVATSIIKYSSGLLNNFLYPFFIEDSQTNKNAVSNNSLTLRWQGVKSKTGIVFYHGSINTESETNYNTFIADTLIKKNRLQNTYSGDFISTTANYSNLISSKVVLQNILSSVVVQQKQFRNSLDTLFVPNIASFGQQTKIMPKSFTLANALKLTKLFNNNTAFDLGFDYYYEKDTRDFETKLTDSSMEDIFQQGDFFKQYFSILGKLKFRLKKASLNTGIALTHNNEEGSLKYKNNTNQGTSLKRNISTFKIPINLQGSIRKLDYYFSASPTLFRTQKNKNNFILKTASALTYNFEQQNNLILGYNHNYRFYDFNSLHDTIVKSYNYKIINNKKNIDSYSVIDDISLSWFNIDVPRSKRIHFVYKYRREQDFLQSVLDSISNNVFYYSNQVFDKKDTHTINTGANKNLYLGSAYHRFDVGGSINYIINRYSTIVNGRPTQVKINSWEPTFNLAFVPRNFFIKKIKNRIKWNYDTFDAGGNKATEQSILTNILILEGSGNKIDWKFDFEYKFYNVKQDRFNVPDCSLSVKYDLSDTLSLSLSGQSLLTLFNLNNYKFINTTSDGNILTQVKNSNNLGYLLFSTSLKF